MTIAPISPIAKGVVWRGGGPVRHRLLSRGAFHILLCAVDYAAQQDTGESLTGIRYSFRPRP